MTKVRGVTGGGIESRNVVHTSNPKREPVSHAVNMTRPSQIGCAVHYQKSPLYAGQGYTPKGPTPQVAGPGGGRMVYRSGSQSKTPRPAPMNDGSFD